MSPALQVFLSGSLTFGVPLLFALREIRVTRRGGGWPGDDPRRPIKGPKPRGGDEGRKPLPPCLLPPYPPLPPTDIEPVSRVLEDVH